MRFLHTADWHIGKHLRGRSRLPEQEAVLQEILDIARREKVDCVLVAGDIFESHAPHPDAERLVYNFFADLAGHGTPAVVIGGNHDHPRRLLALRQLLDALKIYIRPEPCRPDDGGVIEFAVRSERAQIAVLPFVPENRIVDACKLMSPDTEWYSEYAGRVMQICDALTAGFSARTVNIVVAHLYVHGAETTGTERAIHIARPYAVAGSQFSPSAHYVALGHLHRPQEVGGPCPIHYAGSPIQLDFGEQGQQKRVVIIDARAGKPARPESIPLSSGRNLREIIGTLDELRESMAENGNDFLRIKVKAAAPVPGLAEQIREMMPNAIDVQMDLPPAEAKLSDEFRGLSPDALYARYYEETHTGPPAALLLDTFRKLYAEVSDAADQA